MKAVIETTEPVMRPLVSRSAAVTTGSRPLRRFTALVPVHAETALFHAWRA